MVSAYTLDQVAKFFDLIKLPEKYHLSNNPPLDLSFLTALHVHTISTIPYENLDIHYSLAHGNSLDPEILYRKFVLDNRGRGGYCMENSIFFNHVLRALGFNVYTVGIKIRRREPSGRPHGPFVGWVHIANIVTLLSGKRFMVDVGFGGDGATKPLELVENVITPNIGTQELRLVKDHIPSQVHRTPESRMWVYQYRNMPTQDWNSFYAFYDVEFTEADYGVMNWFTGYNPNSPQLEAVLVIKFLRRRTNQGGASEENQDGEGEQEVYGKRMLVNGSVKENLGGKTVIMQECGSEEERVRALMEWFGIELTQEQREGIRGWRTEIRSAGA